MYKEDLALNNLKGLTCHKTKPNQNQIKGKISLNFLRQQYRSFLRKLERHTIEIGHQFHPFRTNIERQANRGNLRSFLLKCGTMAYEWGTQWDSNSFV